jgi:hypothetical protein
MNRRRQTNTLGSTDIRRLEAAKYNAEKLGRPLNCFATFNPVRGGGTFTKDPADLFGDVRNWIKMRLRRYGIEPTAIWTIENSPAGDCPHLHVYLHLPPKLISDFRAAFTRNYPGYDAGGTVADVQPDNGRAKLHWPSGRIGSRFHYMTKQMDAQARYARRNRVWAEPPGPFTGSRFGMTANIFVSAAEIIAAKAASDAQRAA